MNEINHTDLLNCDSAEEVYRKVREFSSDLTEDEHLVRSTILEIHANLEQRLKHILYNLLKWYLFLNDDEEKNEEKTNSLKVTVDDMSFWQVKMILEPLLDSWIFDFSCIQEIQSIRNKAAHLDVHNIEYREENVYEDPETFARLFLDFWTIDRELVEFYEKEIEEPRARAKRNAEFFYENYQPDFEVKDND